MDPTQFLFCNRPDLLDLFELVRREKRDCFVLKIKSGGELKIAEDGEIELFFRDGVFERATVPFGGPFITRNGWRILAAMEFKISELENELKHRANQGIP